MLVNEVMNRDAVWVNPDNRLEEALEIMDEFDLESIPIIDGFTICGTLSRNKLRILLKSPMGASIKDELSSYAPFLFEDSGIDSVIELVPLKNAMDDYFTWCSPSDTIGDAAATMLAYNLQILPVVEHDEFCGVVSRKDLLRSVAMSDESLHSVAHPSDIWADHEGTGGPMRKRSDPSSLPFSMN